MRVTTSFTFLDDGLNLRASDWQLCGDQPAAFRVNGEMRFAGSPVSRETFASFLSEAAPPYANHYDGSFVYAGERFRLTLFDAQDGRCATIRHLPKEIRPLASLAFPAPFLDVLKGPPGLIIVTGPTGSGKSATLASFIDYLNSNEPGVIITVENPIEYQHVSKKCVVRQRELGAHFASFADGLKWVLRQDPDVIMVGEMRDQETISAALSAAETGHFVFATMHTGSAPGAVTRILDGAPAADAPQQRAILAKSLRAVIAQTLIDARDGGRCAVFELLVNTLPVENCIRHSRFEHIADEIVRGSRHGMISMDAALENLVRTRRITKEAALNAARDRVTLAGKLGNFHSHP